MVSRSVAWKAAMPAAAEAEAEAEEDREVWESIMVVDVNGGQHYRALKNLELINPITIFIRLYVISLYLQHY